MNAESNPPPSPRNSRYLWMPLCLGVGVAIGVALDQVAVGISLGVVFGVILFNRNS